MLDRKQRLVLWFPCRSASDLYSFKSKAKHLRYVELTIILKSSIVPPDGATDNSLLPPAIKVCGKVMLLRMFVILFTGDVVSIQGEGLSVQGIFVQGVVSVQVVSVQGLSVQGALSRGSLSRGLSVEGVSVQGGFCLRDHLVW